MRAFTCAVVVVVAVLAGILRNYSHRPCRRYVLKRQLKSELWATSLSKRPRTSSSRLLLPPVKQVKSWPYCTNPFLPNSFATAAATSTTVFSLSLTVKKKVLQMLPVFYRLMNSVHTIAFICGASFGGLFQCRVDSRLYTYEVEMLD